MEELAVFVETPFTGLQKIRNTWWKIEVELPAFSYTLHGSENKNASLQKWSTQIGAGIPARQERRALASYVRGVEHAVSMEERESSVPLGGTAPGDDVDYSAGPMPELRIITASEHLKLQDRILTKWCCGPRHRPRYCLACRQSGKLRFRPARPG